MLHFIFTISERERRGHTHRTVKVWRLVRNEPRHVATCTETFMKGGQLVMEALSRNRKGLPSALFKPHPLGGFFYASLLCAKREGVATFTEIAA